VQFVHGGGLGDGWSGVVVAVGADGGADHGAGSACGQQDERVGGKLRPRAHGANYTRWGYSLNMLERGYTTDKDAYLKRLRRIEGQIRGLQRMVEDDKYCIDILTQVSAATRALQSVALGLLDDHLRHCVAGAVASGDDSESARLLDEATDAIERLVKA
jgi:DNA-binding FrmR family transcriptional regulator